MSAISPHRLDLVYRRDFATRNQARTEIFDYIEVFYNRERIHTAIGGLSPTQFELQNNEQTPPFLLSVIQITPT